MRERTARRHSHLSGSAGFVAVAMGFGVKPHLAWKVDVRCVAPINPDEVKTWTVYWIFPE